MLRRLFLGTLAAAAAAADDESFRVYSDPPRLLLNPRRSRLLKRERERDSIRWRQFHTLMAGSAAMPEPGFAHGLYYHVSGDAAAARRALEFATNPGADTRQAALVYDWCASAATPPQKAALTARLAKDAARPAVTAEAVRDRAFAAIAIAGEHPELSEKALAEIVTVWWRGSIVPAIQEGRRPIARESMLALYELLHVVRDNLRIELREPIEPYFRTLPAFLLTSYYPSPWPAAENEYRIPMMPGAGEPDLRIATYTRASEFAAVAYDTNLLETQFLQGWLIQDRFLLRGPLGAPYEFLWANPYQPGLSYSHLALIFHDRKHQGGALFLRSTWDEDARWLGYLEGKLQFFEQGKLSVFDTSKLEKPLRVGNQAVVASTKFAFDDATPDTVYVLGLKPRGWYDIEIDDEAMYDDQADAGGILEIHPSGPAGIRLKPSSYS
ncbi:MAG TPA: hypothetical protein DEH78_26215 [Solibacterales bacterium]|nr:hypothetical protein [Bryobacterales bacterium]